MAIIAKKPKSTNTEIKLEDTPKAVKDAVKKESSIKKNTKTTDSKVKKTKEAVKSTETLAKAGKRSKKSQEQEAQKAAKEQRKLETKKAEAKTKDKAKADAEVKKQVQKPRVKKYSKNQKAARELLEKDKIYTLKEALELLPKLSKVKFDASAELHFTLGIDPKQSDQMVRTTASLPAGTGKSIRVAVFADEKDSANSKKAGADITDDQKLITDFKKNKFDFDVLVATPTKMAELGRYAKILGPKGLMPSPKNNTVTNDPAKVVEEFKKGRAEIKNDPSGIIHVAFGKLSFKPTDLSANAKAVINAVKNARPNALKGTYLKSVYLTSSMSPSIKLSPTEIFKEAKE